MFLPRVTAVTLALLAGILYSTYPEQSTTGKWLTYPLTFFGFNVHRMHFTFEFIIYAVLLSTALELLYTLGPNATWEKIQAFLKKQRGDLEEQDSASQASGSSTSGSATPKSDILTASVKVR